MWGQCRSAYVKGLYKCPFSRTCISGMTSMQQGTSEEPMAGYEYERSSFAGWIWNRTRAVESLGRAYNYPHQTAVYHSMYRLAADHDHVPSQRPHIWYLKQAALTIKVQNPSASPQSCCSFPTCVHGLAGLSSCDWPSSMTTSTICMQVLPIQTCRQARLTRCGALAFLHADHGGHFCAQAMWSVARWYTQFGLMAGWVFREVLHDLELEGLHDEAASVRGSSPDLSAALRIAFGQIVTFP